MPNDTDAYSEARAAMIASIAAQLSLIAPKLTSAEFLGLLERFVQARANVRPSAPTANGVDHRTLESPTLRLVGDNDGTPVRSSRPAG